ncbi:MAG TPA: DUF1587 domain-containing protein [Bryobacteraceae bacterium]
MLAARVSARLRIIVFITILPALAARADQRAFLDHYCVTCHNQKAKTAGLELDKIDIANIPSNAATWEKVIQKLRGGMMPPAGMPRPDRAAIDAFVASLEQPLDQAYVGKPNPGRVGLHRLNRAEYANAIRDLLSLDIDVASLLPADDATYGFDNIADSLTVSPVLMERYMTSAWKISSLAVGDMKIPPTTYTFRNRPDLSQDRHIEGLPLGTRGGILVNYTFPLDAEYRFKVRFWGNTVNTVRGLELPSQVEVTLDGARVKLATIGGQEDADLGNTNPTASAEQLSKRVELQIPITAGPHKVGFAFLQQSTGPTRRTPPALRPRKDRSHQHRRHPRNRLGLYLRPAQTRQPWRYAQPPPHLHLPPSGQFRSYPLCPPDPLRARPPRLSPPCYRHRHRAPSDLLPTLPNRQSNLRRRHRKRPRLHPRQPAVPLPCRVFWPS